MEALENPSECAFCTMHKKLEADTIHSLLGPSVAYMEDYVRAATNKDGFCAAHLDGLHAAKNRLGLALMLHTHMMDVNKKVEKLYQSKIDGKAKLFSKHTDGLTDFLQNLGDSCYICNLVDDSFDRYLDTFFVLFAKEDVVRNIFATSKGACLPHLQQVCDAAQARLKGKNLQQFFDIMFTAQARYMKKIEADLDWFVKKFDHRNQDEPWGDAKDAVERAIGRLVGTEK